jgi:hypothetical protein
MRTETQQPSSVTLSAELDGTEGFEVRGAIGSSPETSVHIEEAKSLTTAETGTMLNSVPINNYHVIDALAGLRMLPDSCIDCVVTSPPYNKVRRNANTLHATEALDQYSNIGLLNLISCTCGVCLLVYLISVGCGSQYSASRTPTI